MNLKRNFNNNKDNRVKLILLTIFQCVNLNFLITNRMKFREIFNYLITIKTLPQCTIDWDDKEKKKMKIQFLGDDFNERNVHCTSSFHIYWEQSNCLSNEPIKIYPRTFCVCTFYCYAILLPQIHTLCESQHHFWLLYNILCLISKITMKFQKSIIRVCICACKWRQSRRILYFLGLKYKLYMLLIKFSVIREPSLRTAKASAN